MIGQARKDALASVVQARYGRLAGDFAKAALRAAESI